MRKNPLKLVWLAAGFVCLGLGTIGAVLPILPTVPFYMATVLCFAKGSERLHTWFLGTELYRKYLESFRDGYRHPRRQRFRKIYASEAFDADLGCGWRKGVGIRGGCEEDSYRTA